MRTERCAGGVELQLRAITKFILVVMANTFEGRTVLRMYYAVCVRTVLFILSTHALLHAFAPLIEQI